MIEEYVEYFRKLKSKKNIGKLEKKVLKKNDLYRY